MSNNMTQAITFKRNFINLGIWVHWLSLLWSYCENNWENSCTSPKFRFQIDICCIHCCLIMECYTNNRRSLIPRLEILSQSVSSYNPICQFHGAIRVQSKRRFSFGHFVAVEVHIIFSKLFLQTQTNSIFTETSERSRVWLRFKEHRIHTASPDQLHEWCSKLSSTPSFTF